MITLLALLNTASAACTDDIVLTQATTGEAREAGDRFGLAVATGDFNNDGLDDLVVSTPNEEWNGEHHSGMITIHYGTSGSLGSSYDRWSQVSVNGSLHEAGDLFGSALAVGDFNNDGYDDLAFGNYAEDQAGYTHTGRVGVKYGSSAGLAPSNASDSWSQQQVAGVGHGDYAHFGYALAAGDFDGDGYDDLAVSSPNSTIQSKVEAGRVVIMSGASGGLDDANTESFHRGNFPGLTSLSGAHFGVSLAAGDMNGDGKDDLAIGAPDVNHSGVDNAGQVLVKLGSNAGLKASAGSFFVYLSDIGANAFQDDRFGSRLAMGNTNGDSYDDLVIGVASKTVNGVPHAGIVGMFTGTNATTAIVASGENLRSIDAGKPELANNWFGGGVHLADLDQDGYDEVIVGMSGAIGRAGQTAVFYGTANGPSQTDTRFFNESCMGGSVASNQYFGDILTAGDYGDGMRLVAGDPNHTPDNLGAVLLSKIQ